MRDVRAIHAAEFLAQLATLSNEEVAALMERHAGEEVAQVFTEATRALLREVAPMLPAARRTDILERVGGLMLLGYLVRANEEVAPPRPPRVNA
ncbi:hypothetical protein FJV41_23950 [Myxococcus llanfairpwllgwyngyllgogerychwyrndrobwllllantysiliogogogochensis]|uniref:Uncharacterized protein n=1 Tax=Myxococcus llanfairpwllgwyngyllgogerychwyrndrobwllllantysiliogogogochensis TaxID=2590453 RepID=A0A540WWS5_9BACT|nr:hypothetical protein [Myxococcus llanfairpwllgwyngyllgogerychwyrndrobwllllantysiliogogogochensis]TQF13446.1 hypothetical protein FJV41_23950 [Myxococcus llanfairpwllgwyngyllgogerychwyrndrobwllllantysiliogogogochensis]